MANQVYKFRYVGGSRCELYRGFTDVNGERVANVEAGKVYETHNYGDFIRLVGTKSFEAVEDKSPEPVAVKKVSNYPNKAVSDAPDVKLSKETK